MKTFLCVVVLTCAVFAVPRPMEALERYNVVLVHGAAPENQGFGYECDEAVKDAWNTWNDYVVYQNDTAQNQKFPWNLGDAAGMLGDYENKGESKLTYWLDSAVFEDTVRYGSEYIYIQRSFTNPAASPAHNAHEIGDRTWKGKGNCSVRRSLFEEAQEVRVGGLGSLKDKRVSKIASYRTVPSRYILVAHSMGGVASHEYVTDLSVYNGDVDKIITLDSPHEGTGALNLLIDMRDYERQAAEATVQYLLLTTLGTSICAVAKDPYSVGLALWLLVPTFGLSAAERGVTALVDEFALGEDYAFKRGDSLTRYIFPGAEGVAALMARPAHENMPMVRLLAGKGGMTFSDPNAGSGEVLNFLIPEGISTAVKNAVAQLGGDGSESAVYANVETGLVLGLLGGISVQDVGTTLIPEGSGLATSTEAFNGSLADVRQFAFDAAAHANSAGVARQAARNVAAMAGIVSGVIAADIGLSAFPAIQVAAKVAIALSGAAVLGLDMYETGIADIMESHENAKTRRMLDTLYSAGFSYPKIDGGDESGKIRLVEDFLYERPFVNLGLFVSDSALRAVEPGCYYEAESADERQLCEVGLFGADGKVVASNGKRNYSEFRKGDIKFHSASDWSKMGVKVDRWERVPGLTPDGNVVDTLVPIRHVERYEAPAVTVDDWIEKYSFVVDDLMPHRLRQIRLNFNYQEEIAWECDVTKAAEAVDNCTVYKRTGGGEWAELRKEGHPVRKNGLFDFEPRRYGYDNLLALQKDNQNTVTVSTVNKIGLGNTQRFYYLFKATDDLFVPLWPVRDAVVNAAEGFEAFASVLDYQGFAVEGMRDSLWRLSGDTSVPLENLRGMELLRSEGGGKIYRSAISRSALAEGEHHWVIGSVTRNSAEGGTGGGVYDVPFTVDVTPPNFELSVDAESANPDSSAFVARFAWSDTANAPDIRAMRWVLEGGCVGDGAGKCSGPSVELPPLHDVGAKTFAVSWSAVPADVRGNLADGLYRVTATAIDYASPGRAAYDSASSLVNRIAGNAATPADWKVLDEFAFNRRDASVTFRVDRTAPELVFENVGGKALDSLAAPRHAAMPRPERNQNRVYVSGDSLLNIGYAVREPLGGRDSAAVTVDWIFARYASPNTIARAGDSVWIFENDAAEGSWTEMYGMRLEDGDYVVRGTARDEAGNAKPFDLGKIVRVDRTAPKIEGLISKRLVYPDSVKNFTATITVSESNDVATNRTGMRCGYRVIGGDADGVWRGVSEKVLSADTVEFEMEPSAVGEKNGKRYLEAVCVDAAGNVANRTDLFHVGYRYPEITSPVDEDTFHDAENIAIVGIAPPASTDDERTTVFRLRYRHADSTEWHADKISVLSANRSDTANISKTSQSVAGVLGYLHNEGFVEGTKLVVELSVRGCGTCEWRGDSTTIVLDPPEADSALPVVALELSSTKIVAGEDSLGMKLRLDGKFDGGYKVRVYAEDAKSVGVFDKSVDAVYRNSYQGSPSDTNKSAGVWFYENDGTYHLIWKGLAATDSIAVYFDSAGFGRTCQTLDGRSLGKFNCAVEERSVGAFVSDSRINGHLADYAELKTSMRTDSVMHLFGTDGHVLMESETPFRVFAAVSSYESLQNVPVYFGGAEEKGFSFIPAEYSSSLSPWQTGWAVHPSSYSLDYTWDGRLSTGGYPAPGQMRIYAEVVGNVAANPAVMLLDTIVDLSLPEMEIALDKIDGFYLVDNSGLTESSGSLDGEALYSLGSLNIPFSLKYRDAFVSAYILDSKGDTVKVLRENFFVRAGHRENANSVTWDATDKDGVAVSPGTYRVLLVALEDGGENARKTASASFPVSFKRMVPDPDGGVDLYVAEAFNDDGKNRYVPFPDYLIRADVAAKYLPAEKRAGVSMDVEAVGTQTVYGYEPARFSLGIKRRRERLDLVAVTHFQGRLDEITGGTFTPCSEDSHEDVDSIKAYLLNFDSLNPGQVFNFNLDYAGKGRGFDGKNAPSDGIFDIAVLTLRDYENLFGSKTELAESDFAVAKENAVWTLETLTLDASGFKIPGNETAPVAYKYAGGGLGCDVEYEDNVIVKSCTYGDSGTTANYNPNKNLFEVTFVPHESGRFYHDKGNINSHCTDSGDKRYRKFFMNVKLEIPDSYWNAPFGMDNLVNRTIRYDHANKTIFGDGPDGYWNALKSKYEATGDAAYVGNGSYFDGENWHTDPTYGLLTPYEMQYLPFLPADKLSGGLNAFLFADEDAGHMQPSYFDLKFYGPKTAGDYFQVNVLGHALGDLSDCDFSTGNMDVAFGVATPRCQVSFTGLQDSVRTPLFGAGYVGFFVGRNKMWNTGTAAIVPFPMSVDSWKNESGAFRNRCPEKVGYANGSAGCLKYYAGGSKIHYYYGDFAEEAWIGLYTNNGVIKNQVNSPANAWLPNNVSYLDTNLAKGGSGKIVSKIPLKAEHADYANGRFFIPIDTLSKIRENKILDGISLENVYATFTGGGWVLEGDTLYATASDTLVKNKSYRHSTDSVRRAPTRMKSVTIPFGGFTRGFNHWMKDAVIDTAAVLHLDSTEHSHFKISTDRDSSDRLLFYKDADKIAVARPKELVEIRGKLAAGRTYRLSYLKDGVYYGIGEPFTADEDGLRHVAWFDVNKLNGNTQLLLTWGNGNESGDLYYSSYNLYVGSPFQGGVQNTVSSLLGEIDVSLPAGSLENGTEVTVRTSDADDYNFSVYNNLPLVGPVIEVLPHHDFDGKNGYSRIQVAISKAEMEAKNVTPQTLRLYKVDFDNKALVPLTNSLYGYLNADGSPASGNAADTVANCASWDESRCHDGNWAYMLISAETRSFSVFAALDSTLAEVPNIGVEVFPEIAATRERTIQVKGIADFDLYVDDDSLWNDASDKTPATRLSYTMDGNGFAHVALPSRGGDIDTNFVFVVGLAASRDSDSLSELAASPAFARVLTVPAEFACSVPRDSLWFGLDNGYLEYDAACNHPGYGILSLYGEGGEVAEIRGDIPDTFRLDGANSKLADGVYETRYMGVSSLGFDLQVSGPLVYTDSARPVVSAWNVADSADVLDRVFIVTAKVSDKESGVARASVIPAWNGERLQKLEVVPDENGKIRAAVRLTRKQLGECIGCRLHIDFHAEDFGHNYAVREFTSEALYPYTSEIALWYPGYEDAGGIVHEFVGTGHDLNLSAMSNPWGSDAGLYFGNASDKAVGVGNVDLGEVDAYTFETKFKMGHNSGNSWRRLLGFDGANGIKMELQVYGRNLRLVEGPNVWNAGEILPMEKSWTHVAVTVDSSSVNFYIGGELVRNLDISDSPVAGIARELYGKFGVGAGKDLAVLGNVADVRMYAGALSAEQIHALSVPVSADDGGKADIVVADLNAADYGDGVLRRFSCSVPTNRVFVSNADGATVGVDVNVEHAADYGVVLYTRSANVSDGRILVGAAGTLQAGHVWISNTWRAVRLSGVSLPLSPGLHGLTLKLPAGIQLGGIALVGGDVPASSVPWDASGDEKPAASGTRKFKTFLRYEGYPETSTLRPRIRMVNVSDEPVNGFSVRYYFRGEDPALVRATAYYPAQDSVALSIHSESSGLGFAEWKFDGVSIAPKASAFYGDGPHFGLFNYDNTPWVATDDPSFVGVETGSVPNADGFYEDGGIVVLDAEENLIGGSCGEMEDAMISTTKLRVLAKESRGAFA